MSDPRTTNPFSHRRYRLLWRVGKDIAITPDSAPQPLLYDYTLKQQPVTYPEFKTRCIGLDDPIFTYNRRLAECVYCGAKMYSSKRAKLGEEHIIPLGIGGTLILPNASCETCERTISVFENKLINSIFAAARMHSDVHAKRRGRRKHRERLRLIVDGVEKDIFLPKAQHPIMLTMAKLIIPGILCGRRSPRSPGQMRHSEPRDPTSADTFSAISPRKYARIRSENFPLL